MRQLQPLRRLVRLRDWDGPVTRSATIGEWDRQTIETRHTPGIVLMERAAEACFAALNRLVEKPGTLVSLVGPGNNGGDGSAVARLAVEFGWHATIVFAGDEERLSDDARLNLDAARSAGVPVLRHDESTAVGEALAASDVWVDALLGVGNESELRGRIADLVSRANEVRSKRTSSPKVLAIDLPTGLTSDSGQTPGDVLSADATVALGAPKPAHFTPAGIAACGDTYVADIGIIPDDWSRDHKLRSIAATSALRILGNRDSASYKNKLGHVLVIAGSDSMPGAAVLSATSAIRAGAGLVSLASTPAAQVLAIHHEPSIMGVDQEELLGAPERLAEELVGYDSVLFGPGLDADVIPEEFIESLLTSLDGRSCVIDASGLDLLIGRSELVRAATGEIILTPHPGELARLNEQKTADTLKDLPGAALTCAQRYQATVCAKSAGAWVVNGEEELAVYGAEPILATAGTGDVLAGIVATLSIGREPMEAAACAAHVHVEAARRLRRQFGRRNATANEISQQIPDTLSQLSSGDK